MNIVTVPYNSDFYYIRPDISLNRDGNDYFCPDNITEIAVAPFIYIRMDKAGKAISAKFAHRYCSQIGYGLNLTAQSLINEEYPMSFCTANSLDNSTYISQLYQPEEFPAQNIIQAIETSELFNKNTDATIRAKEILGNGIENIKDQFYTHIERITKLSSVRTGDLIILELTPSQIVTQSSRIEFDSFNFSIK